MSKRYNWQEVQSYYDEGHRFSECKRKFGFVGQSWCLAIQRGDLKVKSDIELFLLSLKSGRVNSHNTKLGLLHHGLKEKRCEYCQLTEWNGQSMPLELHHINGSRKDNSLSNLQILCPNCHAQTSTYGTRNRNGSIR